MLSRSFVMKVRKSHFANNLYTEVNSNRRRWDATIMYGRMFDDDNLIAKTSSSEDYEKLKLLRQLSEKAVRENNESAFVAEAFKAVEWMNSLKTSCPFYFPPHLSFIKDPAPWSKVSQNGFTKNI